jgi:hypothetical protein
MAIYSFTTTLMSLFGPNKPKGITPEEFIYVKGELMNAPMGHSEEKLLPRQIEELMNRLQLLLAPNTPEEMRYHWNEVDQADVNQLEGQLDHDTTLHLTESQKAHVKQVLQKYVDIDKHGGLFSL